jgi:hypothetical protein
MSYAGGYAQGLLMNAQAKRAQESIDMDVEKTILDQNNRNREFEQSQQQLGIQLQDAALRKRNADYEIADRERQKTVDKGLSEALASGGYSAGIDYLKTADPNKAIIYHSAKLSLDKQIMENDVLRTTSEVDKQKAMFESYGVMGKIGAGIERAAPEEKERAWKIARPMISKVWPNAPEEYNADAQTAMRLAMAQGTPENMLYDTQKTAVELNSKTGKLAEDVYKAHLKFGPNSLVTKAVQDDLYYTSLEAKTKALSANQLKTKDKQQGEDSLRDDWMKETKDYQTMQDAYTKIRTLTKDPGATLNRGVHDMSIIFSYMKMLDPTSTVREGEYANAENTRGVPDSVAALYNKAKAGEKLTDTQRRSFVDSTRQIFDAQSKTYNHLKGEFSKVVMERGYSPSTLVERKQEDEEMYLKATQQLPKEMQSQAQAALTAAKGDPAKIEQVMKKIQGMLQQNAAPQQGQPNGQ